MTRTVAADDALAVFDAAARVYRVAVGASPEAMVIAALGALGEPGALRLAGAVTEGGPRLPLWTAFCFDVSRLLAGLPAPERRLLVRAYVVPRPVFGRHGAASCDGRCRRHFGTAALGRELGIDSPTVVGIAKRRAVRALADALFPPDERAAGVTGR